MTDRTANVSTPQTCLGLLVLRYNMTSEIYATVVATSAINIAFGLCASVTNLLVFVAILRTTSLHSCSNILLANLCITDFLVGFIVQPCYVTKKVTELLGNPNCEVRLIYTYFGFLCTCASMLGLCLVSGERYIAVMHPLNYYSCVTTPRVCACVGVMWICWATVCCIPFAGVPFGTFFKMVFSVIISSFLFMALIHCQIFKEAKKQQKRIMAGMVSVGNGTKFRLENKVTKTISVVVGAVIFCYLPQISLLLVRALKGDTPRLVHIGDAWADTIVFLNSSFNPFIYCYKNVEIRNGVFRLLTNKRENFLLGKSRKIIPSVISELPTTDTSKKPSVHLQLAEIPDTKGKN